MSVFLDALGLQSESRGKGGAVVDVALDRDLEDRRGAGGEVPLVDELEHLGQQFAALAFVGFIGRGIAILFVADDAGAQRDVDSCDFAAGIAQFQPPITRHQQGAIDVGDFERFGLRVPRVHRQSQARAVELDLVEVDDAASELGLVEIEGQAFQSRGLPQVSSIGEDLHLVGDDALQRQVAQATNFDVGALSGDFALDGRAPRFRHAGVVGPEDDTQRRQAHGEGK